MAHTELLPLAGPSDRGGYRIEERVDVPHSAYRTAWVVDYRDRDTALADMAALVSTVEAAHRPLLADDGVTVLVPATPGRSLYGPHSPRRLVMTEVTR